ncbi:hypothetical protein K2173_012323 [Erythroxylum novogranatense]|uniref:HP domain-containing protein n=1 Tax=Erythroxylum novogranatense TaxID=1862640 RepID=A0AAV8SC42_9ROSI|nr:hypothetical protein K2173_012323 [Erythroxylum novogranatense]
MSHFSNDVDTAFHGSGTKPGVEIWCVENLQLVRVPKSMHGKFYAGNAYLVLKTIFPKCGPPRYDVHYWLGKYANEVESVLASDKALELDSALGSCAVQYREVQGQETEKFLSYFKPCIIPIEGVYSSLPGNVHSKAYKVSLYTCRGDHAVSVKEVPFARSSLNHDEVFILDTASNIFVFSGCNSSIQERAKALEVVQYIKEHKHGGNCEVTPIEDGKLVGDADVGEFWSMFGGYAPIPRDLSSSVQKQHENPSVRLFWITAQGKLFPCESNLLGREILESNKCYMLDAGSDIFVWMGENSSISERKSSISVVENLVREQGRSTTSHLTFLAERLETSTFRSYFESWPQVVETKLYEEGRGKVAAMFKQQGYDVKELPDEKDSQPHINCRGKLKVWQVNGDEATLIPVVDQTKLFTGDCYVVQYIYPGDGRDDNLFYAWLGHESVMEDRVGAISHMSAMAESIKGNAVVAQVFQDKEPRLFFLIFQTAMIFKGGLSKGYKKYISEKGIVDETYNEEKMALFRVQGTSSENMQAIQVDQVSASLNSSYCYILRTGASTFTWMGNLSSSIDHDLLDRMLELINPTWQPISVREGSEPDIFWNTLGGKADYPREKEITGFTEDPRLFQVMSSDGDFKVKEIFNFTQDDLTTEDVLILDNHEEIYVWIGQHSNIKSKQQALILGQKFLQIEFPVKNISFTNPIYVVTEGQEPPFFTHFFEWDSSKANMHGNSFERKLAILKGNKKFQEVSVRNSWKTSPRSSTQDGFRSMSVVSNGSGSSISPMSSVPSTNSNSSQNHLLTSSTPTLRTLFTGPPNHGSSGLPTARESSQFARSLQDDGTDATVNSLIYPFERLRMDSKDPVTNIDVTKREAYLCDQEFEEKFRMRRKEFYGLPKWRQNKLKLSLNLF